MSRRGGRSLAEDEAAPAGLGLGVTLGVPVMAEEKRDMADVVHVKDLPPISPFTGAGDVLEFLEELAVRGRLLGWTPRKSALMLRAFVRGDASRALQGSAVGEDLDSSFDDLSAYLVAQFGTPFTTSVYLQQLGQLRQLSTEQVLAYSLRLRSLLHRLRRTGARVQPAQAVGWFTAGLLPRFGAHFVVHPADDLDAAIRTALQLESAAGMIGAASSAASVAFVAADSEPRVHAVQESRRCHLCGSIGHLKAACPRRRASAQRAGGRDFGSARRYEQGQAGNPPRRPGAAASARQEPCGYCGRPGHVAATCFRRQDE